MGSKTPLRRLPFRLRRDQHFAPAIRERSTPPTAPNSFQSSELDFKILDRLTTLEAWAIQPSQADCGKCDGRLSSGFW